MHDSFILLDDFLLFFGRSFVPLPQNYNNEKQKRMKQIFFSLILSAATLPLAAMTTQNHNSESATAVQKLIFVPDSLKPYNLNDDNARWCWRHSSQTQNVVYFWEKPFGDNT